MRGSPLAAFQNEDLKGALGFAMSCDEVERSARCSGADLSEDLDAHAASFASTQTWFLRSLRSMSGTGPQSCSSE